MFGASFFGYGLSTLIDKIAHGSSASETIRALSLNNSALVGGILLSGIVSVIATIIITSIAQLVAKALGGTGTYPKLVYAFAAFLAPATLIISVAMLIMGYLIYPLVAYVIVLNVLAVRAVHRLGWGKAVLSNLHTIMLVVALPATVFLYLFGDLSPLLQQLANEYEMPVNVSWERTLQTGGGTNLVVEVPSAAIDWVENRDQFACRMAAFARARYQRPESVKAVRVVFSTGQQTGMITLTTPDKVYLWEVTDPAFLACKPGLSDAEKHFKTGAKLDGQGRSPEALVEYNEAIRLSPEYAVAYNNRGTVYNDLGQYQRAIEDFNEAIRLNPGVAIVYLNRGFSYDHLTQYKRAIQDFDAAIRLNAQLAPAYALRALAYTRLGMDAEARQNTDMAVKHGFDPVSLKAKIEELRKAY
jgi:tetratricopeptide (TPR) repeat protein